MKPEPHGLLLDKRVPEDYVFGGAVRLGGDKLVPGGQWDAFLPQDERQNLAMEPEACTSFGTLNAIETLLKQEFGEDQNYSDRFLAKVSITTPQGNSPKIVADALRKQGVVHEQDWPYTVDINTWQAFYASIPQAIQTLALTFLAEFDFGYEFVNVDYQSQQAMMDALEYSPLCADVYAWEANYEGLYIRGGNLSNHWICIYGYERNRYWKCFDSYTQTHKELVWDFGFSQVMKYTLHKNVIVDSAFTTFLKKLWAILFPMPSTDNDPVVPVLVQPPVVAPVVPATPPQYPDARVQPPKPKFPAMIVKWASAIAIGEGAHPDSNNPGNLKYSSLTASWGATRGRKALDGGYFCQFATLQAGKDALCNFLVLGAEDQLIAFHKPEARTLEGFTKIYAGNPPLGYIKGIEAYLGVQGYVLISTFLV